MAIQLFTAFSFLQITFHECIAAKSKSASQLHSLSLPSQNPPSFRLPFNVRLQRPFTTSVLDIRVSYHTLIIQSGCFFFSRRRNAACEWCYSKHAFPNHAQLQRSPSQWTDWRSLHKWNSPLSS